MTEGKKLRILQKYIDDGLGEQVVINVVDALDREHTIRKKITIADLFDMISNKENLNEYPNFKEINKAIEKNRAIYIGGMFKDTIEKYIETQKNNTKIGSPDDAYVNEIKQID